jgi:hypothetical protein
MSDDQTSKLIKSVLDFDPIAAAEAKDNFGVGLAFVQDQRAMLNRLMAHTSDVCSDTGFADYCRIASDFGFVTVYDAPFPGNYGEEQFRIMWHEAGFLLSAESFDWSDGVPEVNMARLYYNIQTTREQMTNFSNYTSSE